MRNLLIAVMLTLFASFQLNAEEVVLNKSNSVTLNSVVDTDSVSKAISELIEREGNDEPVIYLVLDTPGGSVFSGLKLISQLKNSKKEVKTISIFSASMGFQIAQGNPGARLIADTGILMSHPMSGGVYGELGSGMSVENQSGFLKEIIKTMDETTVARTNGKQTLESYQKAYDNELWTTGNNAVEAGYADGVTSVSCSKDLADSIDTTDVREYLGDIYALEIKYENSKCPLIDDVLKYQVAIVNIATGKRYVIMNKGYALDAPAAQESIFGQTPELRRVAENSTNYKNLMFKINRDFKLIKSINKF